MIRLAALPADALLASYRDRAGAYTDCYVTDIRGAVPLATFVTAFYTTPLFRVERAILAIAARSPSTDEEARQVASGLRDDFAAWTVEARAPGQILMCDLTGSTRSWFQVAPGPAPGTTRLHFGSAVVPAGGGTRLGIGVRLLLGFHKLYSRALLAAARRRLRRAS